METTINQTNDPDSIYVKEIQNLTFQNQGQTVEDQTISKFVDLPPSYLNMSIAQDRVHGILDFLQRPVKVFNGTFDVTAIQGQILSTLRFPDVLAVNRMYAEKLAGFVGLRAKVEIIVQVNAMKFQQGLLRLAYYPYARYQQDKVNMTISTVTGLTSLPGIDIDISGGSNPQSRIAEAKLMIQYVSPHDYINLITTAGTMGDVYLFVYSPLLTGSAESTNCEITMWARFCEPELVFPTSASLGFTETRVHEAQVRGEARQIEQTGVVSQTLGTVAETLSIAKRIPVIGEYLAIPEWVASKGSAIAKLFGWSKPTLTMDTKLRTQNCMTNYNGKDSSYKMGLSADNEIDTPRGIAGTDLDEMALTSVASIPAFWEQFTWDNTMTTQDQILYVDAVSPLKRVSLLTTTNGSVLLPIGFISQCFGLWRGSLVYTFKIIKTGFHTGRLRVFYTPYEKAANLPVGGVPVNQIEKNYQMVIDIAESDTFTFSVPFVSTKPWLDVQGIPTTDPAGLSITGYVVVTVLNELRAISNVSPSVNIIVEVSGGPDLTFACPKQPRFLPGVPTPALREHEAQVLGTGVSRPRNEAQMLMAPESISAIDPISNWSPESHCIGEKVVSIRQLVKRAGYLGYSREIRTNVDGTTTRGYNTITVMNPFGFNNIKPNVSEYNGIDYLSYFSFIFAFFRGGVRIKIAGMSTGIDSPNGPADDTGVLFHGLTQQVSSLNVKMLNSIDDTSLKIRDIVRVDSNTIGRIIANDVDPSLSTSPLYVMPCSTNIVKQGIEGLVEVEVPFYNSSHISPALYFNTNTLFPQFTETSTESAYPLPMLMFSSVLNRRQTPLVIDSTPAANASLGTYSVTDYQIFRSAADDFSFNYITGVPTMIITPQLNNLVTPPPLP